MKLVQVYANYPFKKVKFNEGFNLILGKVTKPKDKKIDSHNLGKTTLISIIDFLLLKKLTPHHFLLKHPQFKEYTFYLEILLNNGKYLTIRRSVDKNTKIAFKLHTSKYANFIDNIIWDHEDLTIDKAKDFLNEALAFNVVTKYSYRKIVSYFLRSQDDYLDVFQLNKYSSGRDTEWKPMLFDLLGFDGNLLENKYLLDQKTEKLKDTIDELQNRSATKADELDKLKGFIEIKEEEIRSKKVLIDEFNFYKKEMGINTELVEEIEREVSQLNTLRYNLEYEIDKIKNSQENNPEFNVKEIELIFKEVEIHFPSQIKKRYEELEVFNQLLSTERNKHLNERLKILKQQYLEVDEKLRTVNEKRSKLLELLRDKDTFKKYKQHQTDLIKSQSEIAILKEQLSKLNEIGDLSLEVGKLNNEIEGARAQIVRIVSDDNQDYTEIRKTFSQIVRDIISLPALISIKINKAGNVEYESDIQNINQTEVTSKGEGTTYRKLLCVAFDLAVLIHYSKNSFFKFVYHDGALEGLDNRKKLNFVATIKSICNKYDLQYILTSIEDDLPRDDEGKLFKFTENEICLELSDEGDKGRLFEQSF